MDRCEIIVKKESQGEEIKRGSKIMRQDNEKEKALERKMSKGAVGIRSKEKGIKSR